MAAGELARRAAKEGWSVRELERKVGTGERRTKARKAKPKSPVVQALEQALEEYLATRVEVREGRGGKGTIEIRYHSAEDFERLFELIGGRPLGEVVE